MRKVYIICLLFSWSFTFAQDKEILYINKVDSIIVQNTWANFSKGLFYKDAALIKSMSFNIVYCARCTKIDTTVDEAPTWFVPIDTFIAKIYQITNNGRLDKIKNGKYHFDKRKIEGKWYEILELKSREYVTIYELWFETKESSRNYEGQSMGFSFAHIDDKLIFVGFYTTP